ncbi:hypothetical protein Bca101_043950 [Brassica carinata]
MIKYIRGVDRSFYKEDTSVAYFSLSSRDISRRVVHHEYSPLCFHVPYVHGFLSLFSFCKRGG